MAKTNTQCFEAVPTMEPLDSGNNNQHGDIPIAETVHTTSAIRPLRNANEDEDVAATTNNPLSSTLFEGEEEPTGSSTSGSGVVRHSRRTGGGHFVLYSGGVVCVLCVSSWNDVFLCYW
jgi:hypothetical protein